MLKLLEDEAREKKSENNHNNKPSGSEQGGKKDHQDKNRGGNQGGNRDKKPHNNGKNEGRNRERHGKGERDKQSGGEQGQS